MAASDFSEVLARVSSIVSESPTFHQSKIIAMDTGIVLKKLLWSTGKAAWIAGTSLVVLTLPLFIEMDREQQLIDLELQQSSLLGTCRA